MEPKGKCTYYFSSKCLGVKMQDINPYAVQSLEGVGLRAGHKFWELPAFGPEV